MKITVNARALEASLKNGIAGKKDDIYSHVLITADSAISLTTLDRNCESELMLEGAIDETGAIASQAERLRSVLCGLVGDVLLSTANEGLSVSQDGRNFLIPSRPTGDFPLGPEIEGEDIGVNGSIIAKAISRVAYVSAKNDVRYYLNGVCLAGGSVIATDGHRASRCKVEGMKAEGHIIPTASVPGIIKALEQQGAKLFLSARSAEVRHPLGRFRTALIDGRYPDTDYVFAVPNAPSVELNSADLLGPLSRFSKIASKNYGLVRFRADGDRIKLLNTSEDSFDFAPADITGAWEDVGLNQKYLVDIAKSINGDFKWINPGPTGIQVFLGQDDNFIDICQPARI